MYHFFIIFHYLLLWLIKEIVREVQKRKLCLLKIRGLFQQVTWCQI